VGARGNVIVDEYPESKSILKIPRPQNIFFTNGAIHYWRLCDGLGLPVSCLSHHFLKLLAFKPDFSREIDQGARLFDRSFFDQSSYAEAAEVITKQIRIQILATRRALLELTVSSGNASTSANGIS